MVGISPAFAPAILRGIKIFPDDPLRLDFFIDTGDSPWQDEQLTEESSKLIKYFLTSLTVPEGDLWVNLSPYELERIIPEQFGITEMGRDLLAQDYLLKQLTASLLYPERDLGREFWDRVYQKAYALYQTTEIPINTFNKIWIVPQRAVVYEQGDMAFVLDSHLKVMLEADYLALKENLGKETIGADQFTAEEAQKLNDVSSDVVKEVILPEIEREVNEGENFSTLRQIYHSMILATWFKINLKESLFGKVYVDQNKVTGVDIDDRQAKEKIYQQYLEAFRKGVYDYIKEDYDPTLKEVVPRKFFSGGFAYGRLEPIVRGNTLIDRGAIDVLVRRGELPAGVLEGDVVLVEDGVRPVRENRSVQAPSMQNNSTFDAQDDAWGDFNVGPASSPVGGRG